jgi:glycosyltransferase involved in cell wall biosynthesis
MAKARIIIPCYNEESRLDVAGFRHFKSSPHEITFLFVNDGSTDTTQRLLECLATEDPSRFTVLNLAQNRGKAEAVRQGYLSAIATHPAYVGFWDADLATPLMAIHQFIEIAESRPELEMVIGSRVKLLGRRVERRPIRHYLGRFFATAVSKVLGLEVYDTQCGAKLFKVSSRTNTLFELPFSSRWIFDVEIIARLIQPLTEWTDIPGSKLTYGDFFRAAWELFRLHRLYFRHTPARSTPELR